MRQRDLQLSGARGVWGLWEEVDQGGALWALHQGSTPACALHWLTGRQIRQNRRLHHVSARQGDLQREQGAGGGRSIESGVRRREGKVSCINNGLLCVWEWCWFTGTLFFVVKLSSLKSCFVLFFSKWVQTKGYFQRSTLTVQLVLPDSLQMHVFALKEEAVICMTTSHSTIKAWNQTLNLFAVVQQCSTELHYAKISLKSLLSILVFSDDQ